MLGIEFLMLDRVYLVNKRGVWGEGVITLTILKYKMLQNILPTSELYLFGRPLCFLVAAAGSWSLAFTIYSCVGLLW